MLFITGSVVFYISSFKTLKSKIKHHIQVYYTCKACQNVTRQDTDYAGIQISDLEETTLYKVTIEPVAANGVPGVQADQPVITEARTVEDLSQDSKIYDIKY